MLNDDLKKMIAAIVIKKPSFKEVKPEELDESIERAAIQVSRYCRLRLIPEEMKYIIADMVADIYEMDHYVKSAEEDDFSSRVTKLTQGDTTIELETEVKAVPFSSMKEILAHYQNELIVYRGIYWR